MTNTNTIEAKLRQAWRQQRRYINLRGGSRFLLWLIFMITLDFVIDWGVFFRFRWTSQLGLLLLVVNVVVLTCVLWYEWLRHLKPFKPLLVALDIEDKHPELASLLVSYTQLDGTANNQSDVSVELIDAMREQALLQTHKLDFREIVNFGQLKRLFLVAAGVLLVFSTLSYLGQDHVRVLAQRLVGLGADYPTQTQVTSVSGDLTIRAGDSVEVVAEVAGVIPDDGVIYVRPVDDSADWKALPLKKNSSSPTFQRELKEVVKDLKYYVRIGDDQSKEYRIQVVPAPRIVAAKIDLTYPKYMDKAPGQEDQLNLEVPEGTRIRWQLSCDTPVKQLIVKFGHPSNDKIERKVAAKVDETGKNITFELEASEGVKYTFVWTKDNSGKDFEYGDVQHNVRVIPDSIPEVELVQPGSDGLATPQKTFKLVARARDDHGLANAWLVYAIDGSEEKRVPLHDFKGKPAAEFIIPWALKENIKDLKPGVQISVAVEVTDRNPAAQRLRRSATRQFKIVTQEHYIQWYRQELAAQRDEIMRVREREQSSSEAIKQLNKQESGK